MLKTMINLIFRTNSRISPLKMFSFTTDVQTNQLYQKFQNLHNHVMKSVTKFISELYNLESSINLL